jgi:hypothetical protein
MGSLRAVCNPAPQRPLKGVDLDHELVISQTRRRAGSDYDKHLLKSLIALEEGLR